MEEYQEPAIPLKMLYGAVFLFIIAVLVLASLFYGPELWWVKVLIGGGLLAFSALFAALYLRSMGRGRGD
ncbi:MAG: hypothetical protein HY347_09575 [candidate division NC10 bacterium]|nr:hypothetical protein [candidate division NC10 bacterium]